MCAFFRLKGSSSGRGQPGDDRTLCLIRRVTLDAFWSRKRGTVRQQLGIFSTEVRYWRNAWHYDDLLGPFRLNHDFGMRMAIGVLEKSLKAGAMKRLRSSRMFGRSLHTNMYKSSFWSRFRRFF
jgi:hypothetical protein